MMLLHFTPSTILLHMHRATGLLAIATLSVLAMGAAGARRDPAAAAGGEASPAACAQRLENGICLPAAWPPAANFSAVLKMPPYLLNPPSVINISRGRQLFVDSFLIAETNAVTSFHAGEYASENPVLTPDQPWEKTPPPPGSSVGGGRAMPFSGGAWYYNKSFHLWYNCGPSRSGNVSNTCYATSANGRTWTKPLFNDGTNAVRGSARHDGNTVWLDRRETNPARRFKIAEVRSEQQDQHYTLHQSADGLDWQVIKNKTGPISDRSTFFFDPLRERWVFTNKVNGETTTPDGKKKLQFGRSHAYFASQTDQLCDWTPAAPESAGHAQSLATEECSKEDAAWTELYSSTSLSEPRPWVVADADDPVLLMPNGTAFQFNKGSGTVNPNQLYNLDAIGHESLLVGQFSVRETNVLSRFFIRLKTIILPRQARDKHRKS